MKTRVASTAARTPNPVAIADESRPEVGRRAVTSEKRRARKARPQAGQLMALEA